MLDAAHTRDIDARLAFLLGSLASFAGVALAATTGVGL